VRQIGIVLLFLMLLPGMVEAAQSPTWEYGLRGGMDAKRAEENFTAAELYLLRAFAWRADPGVGSLYARLDIGAGFLEAAGDRGGWLAGGADLVWQLAGDRMEIEAGLRPTWLIDHTYGDDDFGGELQFASHLGIALHVTPVVFSYRYQHLSNAHIYPKNGGLDLHLFGLGTRF